MTRQLTTIVIGLLYFCYCCCTVHAQNATEVQWTWISGSNITMNTRGAYGQKNIPNTSNYPGAREDAMVWYDSEAQEIWLFGGLGYAAAGNEGRLNDLWRYRMNDSTWTWVSGSDKINEKGKYGTRGQTSNDSMPGAREDAVGWFDSDTKELWLFGGHGLASTTDIGRLNDLWRYRVNDSTWTWISGSNSIDSAGVYGQRGDASASYSPKSRENPGAWYDSVNKEFWLFGGESAAPGSMGWLNDLWRFRVNDSTWTWLSGSQYVNQKGKYGQQGVPASGNVPGARDDCFGWYDSSTQEFWLFGGWGHAENSNSPGFLNDLWKYSVNNDTWTWVAGSKSLNQKGKYGDQGIASADNIPGGHEDGVGWYDSVKREFWMFGGKGYGNGSSSGFLNDLWRYRMNDSTWTWISGSSTVNKTGVYGQLGVPSPDNTPSSREGPSRYFDSSTKSFWFFGGYGFINSTKVGMLNDFWRLTTQIQEPEEEPAPTPEQEPCPPLYHQINNTCVPLLNCSSENSDDSSTCVLDCDSLSSDHCLIDGDIVVNGTKDITTITIIGVLNITGNVIVADEVIVKLVPGSTLHVGQCLVLEEGAEIVVVVDTEVTNTQVLATYDPSCSSPDLDEKLRIESSSFDVCRYGIPVLQKQAEGDGNIIRVELVFVPAMDSSECSSEFNVLAVSVAVSVVAVMSIVIVVIFAVPKLRSKIVPMCARSEVK